MVAVLLLLMKGLGSKPSWECMHGGRFGIEGLSLGEGGGLKPRVTRCQTLLFVHHSSSLLFLTRSYSLELTTHGQPVPCDCGVRASVSLRTQCVQVTKEQPGKRPPPEDHHRALGIRLL